MANRTENGPESPLGPCLTHIALHCRDLDASLAFYKDFCGLQTVSERPIPGSDQAVHWLSEPGNETRFIFVLLPGGPERKAPAGPDYSHFGFALGSRAAVDSIAARAEAAGCLEWAPREEPYPVGYYCGLKDPDGNFVEFSYGQPLGPGAEDKAT